MYVTACDLEQLKLQVSLIIAFRFARRLMCAIVSEHQRTLAGISRPSDSRRLSWPRWLIHTEVVCPPDDSDPSQYQPDSTYTNLVDTPSAVDRHIKLCLKSMDTQHSTRPTIAKLLSVLFCYTVTKRTACT